MAEAIKGIFEGLEANLGEVLQARDAFTKAAPIGLGPPDLCIVFKQYEKAFVPAVLQTPQKITYFHHVIGLDVSSAAAVAAYFGDMVNHQEPSAVWSPARYKLIGGLYCTYDSFSHVDLRIEFNIPGGVKSFVVDKAGSRHPATEDHWKHVSLCNMLRAVSGSEPPAHTLSAVRMLLPITSPQVEQRFLAAAQALYRQGTVLGTDVGGVAEAATSRLLLSVKKHFMDMKRYTHAISFFSQLAADDAAVFAHVADVFMTLGMTTDAIKALQEGEKLRPNNPLLLTTHAQIMLEEGQIDEAIRLATAATRAVRDRPLAFFILARAYVTRKEYGAALVVLNGATVREQRASPLAIPKAARVTAPAAGAVPPPPAPPEDDDPEDPLLGARLHGHMREAYDVLVEMLLVLGWDALLDTRSQVFVMEGEPAARGPQLTASSGHGSNAAPPASGAVALAVAGAKKLPTEVRRAYTVLGVAPAASDEEIAEAFKQQMQEEPSELLTAAAAALARYRASSVLRAAVEDAGGKVGPFTPPTTAASAPQGSDAATAPTAPAAAADSAVGTASGEQSAEHTSAAAPSGDATSATAAASHEGSDGAPGAAETMQPRPASPSLAHAADTVAESPAPKAKSAPSGDVTEGAENAHTAAAPAAVASTAASADTAPEAAPATAATTATTAAEQAPAVTETVAAGPTPLAQAAPAAVEKVAAAAAADSDAAAAPAPATKVLCQRWMDLLFHALFDDLRAYSDVLHTRDMAEAAAASTAAAVAATTAAATGTAPAAAGGAASGQPASAPAAAGAAPVPPVAPVLTAQDWVRQARLAERLHRYADAERAYRNAVGAAWDYRGWLGLLTLYSRGGYTREALVAAEQILRWWDLQVGGAEAKDEYPQAPAAVQQAVFHLVAVHGLQAVRDAQAALGPPHLALNNLFHDVVRWHVHGFDM